MNIIANNVVAKLAVAFVAAAMLFSFATPAKAATVEELQAQIAALMAQISALSGGDSMSSAACTFTRSLTIGSEGADVTCLQDYLTPTYFNFAGGSTGYFGPVTASAVAAWQSANGVAPAVGYFGPVSQAKYNELAAMSGDHDHGDDSSDDSDDSSDDSDDSSDGSLSGEASLDTLEIDDAEDDELEEGAEDAEIGTVTIEFTDGDAEISRMDITLDNGPTDVDPWDVFESISFWVDGDKIAEENADDEDDYLDEDTGELRFSGLDIIGEEDEEVEIVIAATLAGNVDTGDLGEWDLTVTSIRFFDADGVATTETSGFDIGTAVTFEVVEEGVDDELIVKTSSSDPDGTTLQLEDDSDSDWFMVFAFDLDTDDSVNDIEINTIPVTFAVSSGTVSAIVDDFELVIDGVTIDDWTYGGADTATRTIEFDVDGDVVIDAGDRVTAELMVKFNSLDLGNEGMTASGTLTSAQADMIDAEGADDLDDTQTSGAASGDDHTLRTAGIDASLEDTAASVTTGDTDDDDYATFTIEIEVTAFEQDVYISTDPSVSISYEIEDGASVATTSGDRTVTLTSTGDEEGSAFEITDGSTETLTLEVTYDPSVTTSTSARLDLNSITFGSSSGSPTGQSWAASPNETYRTAVVTIVN